MTNPYPPQQPPRRLERSRTNRVLGGVCGGVADYVNMDPTLVRVLTVVISLFTGVPIIVYLIALFALPEADPDRPPQGYPPVNAAWNSGIYTPGPFQSGQVPPAQPYQPDPAQRPGPAPHFGDKAASGDEAIWGQEGAPWEQRTAPANGFNPAPEQTSTWESTPADPEPAGPTASDPTSAESGTTEPDSSYPGPGDKQV